MQREFAFYDEMALVTNLRPDDEVLIIGSNLSLPFVSGATIVKFQSELEDMLQKQTIKFDRIFIGRENYISEELITRSVALLRDEGLICFMSDHEGMRLAFAEIIETNYPEASIWLFDSNIGPIVVTDAKGISRWLN